MKRTVVVLVPVEVDLYEHQNEEEIGTIKHPSTDDIKRSLHMGYDYKSKDDAMDSMRLAGVQSYKGA